MWFSSEADRPSDLERERRGLGDAVERVVRYQRVVVDVDVVRVRRVEEESDLRNRN